ncbi:MAG: hypothetical protein CBC01_06215 [Betaproteobacteria bacterium TMED41]|nr:MAG: hypothetical protein CBC01_06215 [Betaproteobacteria bacterium TMED41]|tara:strand:- start:324 stop:629 length:306 start_codon:yes stop_codon:yes gene_type:complete
MEREVFLLLIKKYLVFVPLLLIQYPLWIGETGWLDVWEKEKNLHSMEIDLNDDKKKLLEIKAEVRDFRDGYNSIEEKARYEMGMIKPKEKFLQLVVPNENP